jgi:hypothetical protein
MATSSFPESRCGCRAHGVCVVRVADWPHVHVWNSRLGLLKVVDTRSGKILSRLLVTDDPQIEKIDPAALEKADSEQLLRLRSLGYLVVSEGGRYAYYLPQQLVGGRGEPRQPGFVRRIDLATDPPKIIRTSKERQPDLAAGTATVSETVGRVFVLKDEPPRDFRHVPSNRIKVLSTDDLTLKHEIKPSLTDCNGLKTSRDGKYLYALDPEAGQMAVIDCATGREVKVLENLGKYPHVMITLAD